MSDSSIPSEWVETTIGSICVINPKNKLDDADVVGFLPMVAVPQDFGDKPQYEERQWAKAKKGYTHFQENDVLFAKVTPCFENGKSMIAKKCPSGFGSGSSELIVLRTDQSLVVPELVLHLIRTYDFKQLGARSMTGAVGLRRVPKAFVEQFPFPLPPLAEQKEIAARLDDLLAQVGSAKTRLDGLPNILKRFRQSVLAAATSGKLTEEWRNETHFEKRCETTLKKKMLQAWLESKDREFARKDKRPKTDNWKNQYKEPKFESLLSGEWFSVELQHVAEILDPNPSHRMPKYVSEGIPFISSENIIDSSAIDFNKGKKITEEELTKQKQRYEISDGTFAFTRIGTIGKSVTLPKPHAYGISHAMAVITPYKLLMDPPFLQLVISCESILRQATHGVQSVGVPDLGIGKMKSFKIPLPRLEEQTEIVRRVTELFAFADQVEQRVKEAQAHVNHLTQSILAKAFRGELTEQWRKENPDRITGENSAAALLERIKTERGKGSADEF